MRLFLAHIQVCSLSTVLLTVLHMAICVTKRALLLCAAG